MSILIQPHKVYQSKLLIQALYPPGFLKEAKDDLQRVWNLYLKFQEQLGAAGKKKLESPGLHEWQQFLLLSDVSFDFALFLVLHGRVFRDLRLVVQKGRLSQVGMLSKWIDQAMIGLWVEGAIEIFADCEASKIFHEGMVLEHLEKSLVSQNLKVRHSHSVESDIQKCYINIYRDVAHLSLSLTGNKLHHRGLKFGGLDHSSPLAEDLAHACLLKSHFKEKLRFHPLVCVPFVGTGTFVFESILAAQDGLCYQKHSRFPVENWLPFKKNDFEHKKKYHWIGVPVSQKPLLILANDTDPKCVEAVSSVVEKSISQMECPLPNNSKTLGELFQVSVQEGTYAQQVIPPESNSIFFPLNPPFGIRMGKEAESLEIYANVGKWVKRTSARKPLGASGFILCPSESHWKAFWKELGPGFTQKTSHFTQGGLDMRLCVFESKK